MREAGESIWIVFKILMMMLNFSKYTVLEEFELTTKKNLNFTYNTHNPCFPSHNNNGKKQNQLTEKELYENI